MKRFGWIDTLRGAAMVAIIAFHTGFLPHIAIANPLLMSWALPAFLVSGGYLLKDRPLTPIRFRLVLRRLLVPFFLAGGISFLGWLYLRSAYPAHTLLQPITTDLVKAFTGRNPYFDSPLWFIPTFLIATIVMQAVAHVWFRTGRLLQIAFTVVTLWAGFAIAKPFTYPVFSYDLVILFIGMMMLGSLLKYAYIPQSRAANLSLAFLFISIALGNGYIDMFQRQFGNPFVYVVEAVLGIIVFARLSERVRALAGIGRHSMAYMVWHWPVLQWLTFILYVLRLIPSATGFSKTAFIPLAAGTLPQVLLCAGYTAVALGAIAFFIQDTEV